MSTNTIHLETPSWYHRRHHRPGGGFRNIWGTPRDVPFFKSAAWLLQHPFSQKENAPPPLQYPTPEALRRRPGRLRLTWLGHATTHIQTPALDLLTDPIFSDRASPVSFAGPKRELPLPLPLDALPGVDVVLLSHDHYGPFFTEIRERLGAPEVAILPIGAYLPRWFMAGVHVDPQEAVGAFIDLQADHFVPVHWGTFDLADEPIQEPAARTQQHADARGIAGRLHVLDVGETFSLPAAAAATADAPETPAATNPSP